MSGFLPYGRQVVEDDDIAAVVATLRGDWLTTGPAVGRFEQELATRVDAPHALACSSGTAALHLAAMAAGLGEGVCAIVPTVTFLATASAVRFTGAEVVFADVDPDTALMRPTDLEQAIARAKWPVKAILPVHFAGQGEDSPALRKIAERAGALVIEDACHALGGSYQRGNAEARYGSCADADMAAFSFHPVKTIAMGEGGAVTTRDPALAERIERFRNHGMIRDAGRFENRTLAFDAGGAPNSWYYEMPAPGLNYRASDIHCALGASQLQKLDRFVETRRRLAELYDRLLAPLAPAVRPLSRTARCNPAWHLYVALIDFKLIGRTRSEFMAALRAKNIGTQVHYVPVSWQPYFAARYGDTPMPGAARYYERCLSLPLYASMTADDVEYVCATLREAVERRQ